MWHRWRQPILAAISSAGIALLIAYVIYRVLDPLPPRHITIAAGPAGSAYDGFARQYATILMRHGVRTEIRNAAGALEDFNLLRNPGSGVQAGFTTLGFVQSEDADTLYSLGGIPAGVIFIFYRSADPITLFSQFRGKRLSIGVPGSALRAIMFQVLKATDGLDDSTQLFDLDNAESVNALIAGKIDLAAFPSQIDHTVLQRALGGPGLRLMDIAQAGAIAKIIPELKHVVLWRGLISLGRDIPSSGINLIALRNRLVVRKDLHPALQYLLLEAMREVHWAPGPFNHIGEFPSEQPNDLPLSPTAQAFYRSGSTFWQRYTTFWLTSLLNQILFFVLPVVVSLIPVFGFALPFYRWLNTRRIARLHRSLGHLEREIPQTSNKTHLSECHSRLGEIESVIRSLRVARPFEVDLQRLKIHLRMVQEEIGRLELANQQPASKCLADPPSRSNS
jgi:uncharacterized protein